MEARLDLNNQITDNLLKLVVSRIARFVLYISFVSSGGGRRLRRGTGASPW